jgi:cytochrome P450
VRICLWEAHKDTENFENPFSFDPERLFNTAFNGDQFCPFGMGHHQCPAADATVQLATLFIEVYAKFRLAAEKAKPTRLDVGQEPGHFA